MVVQTLIAALSATAAACFLGLRAQMLKPHLASWPDAPRGVRYSTFGLSIILGGYVVSVCNGYRPSSGEAAICLALAVYGFLLWFNLFKQVRAAST